MKQETLYILIGTAIVVVFLSKSIASILFNKMDEFFVKKKELKGFDDIDSVIEARTMLMRNGVAASTTSEKKAPEALKIEQIQTPEEKKRIEIMKRIYAFDKLKISGEAEIDYYKRILGICENSDLKKNYKQMCKVFHPDRFDLRLFDQKTKDKLTKKIHENFLLIQKAYDYLK